jgi:HEPN domain-containing protein
MNDMQEYTNSHFLDGRITIIAQSWDHIVTAIEKGKTFFNHVLKNGLILYRSNDDGYKEFPIPDIDHAAVLDAAERVYKTKKELANGFLRAAEVCLSTNYNSNALFFLHQATEQACIQAIRLHIDYRCEFHNLERLLDLIECFKPGLGSWFICSIGEDKRLFKLLKESYSTSRYRNDFIADKNDVKEIYEHVAKFVDEANSISFNRLGRLTQMAQSAAQDLADYKPALMAT